MPDLATIVDVPALTLDASAVDALPTRRIVVAKLGQYQDPRYGAFGITDADLTSWQRNLAEGFGGRAAIDFDHSPEKGKGTKAAGWITNLHRQTGAQLQASDPDRFKELDPAAVYAASDVEFSKAGAEAIRNREYRYISPTFTEWSDETGKKRGQTLIGAGLTNRPFLRRGMPVISLSADDLAAPAEEVIALGTLTGKQRDDLADSDFAVPATRGYPIPNRAHAEDALARSAGKPEEVEVRAAVHRRYPDLGHPGAGGGASDSRGRMSLTAIAKALGLANPEAATEATILDAFPSDAAGGVKILSAETYAGLIGRAAAGDAAVKSLSENRFTVAWDKAIAEVRVTPPQEAEFKELADLSVDLAVKTLDGLPKVGVPTGPRGHGRETDTGTDAPDGVDPDRHALDEKVTAYMLEHNVDDYVKALDAVVRAGGAD